MSQAAHTITGYDLTNVVKGFVSYQLPFGRGQQWLATHKPLVNGIVGGWTLASSGELLHRPAVRGRRGQSLLAAVGQYLSAFNLTSYKGPSNPRRYVPIPPGTSQFLRRTSTCPPLLRATRRRACCRLPANSALRCPGQANENATLLKNQRTGPEGKYGISFRADFYNLFNRHYYEIVGCGSSPDHQRAPINSPIFGEIEGVQDSPRQGQFAIRLDF